MIVPTDICGECGTRQRVTLKNLIYKHGDCPGGGQEPHMAEMSGEAEPRWAMKEFTPSEILVRDGFTNEQLEKMLSDITPKRQKLRQAVRARVAGFVANVRNYFNGAWDVFDDE